MGLEVGGGGVEGFGGLDGLGASGTSAPNGSKGSSGVERPLEGAGADLGGRGWVLRGLRNSSLEGSSTAYLENATSGNGLGALEAGIGTGLTGRPQNSSMVGRGASKVSGESNAGWRNEKCRLDPFW